MSSLTKKNSGTLAHYDPEKGLKTIAVSEAAEKHFARAKDATQLFKAIETKLTAQREFVLWWDGQGDKRGGDGSNQHGKSKRRSTATLAGKDGIPMRHVIERWRKKTKDTKSFRIALEEAQHRCQRICEQEKISTVRGTEGTGEFERYTPPEYITAARKALGVIDLDPASNKIAQRTVKAKKFFTVKDDGLKQQWNGRVFLNPPYHRDLAPEFIQKLVDEIKAGRVKEAILLTNNSTDTDWFCVAQDACQAICFTHGRIKFTQPNGVEVLPTQGQAFFYFGKNIKRFAEAFSGIGFGMKSAFRFEGDNDDDTVSKKIQRIEDTLV